MVWHTSPMNASQNRAYAPSGIPAWTFGDKVRKARDITGLGQKEFAAKIGVTSSSLAAYETGRTTPRFNDAPTIAKSIQMLTGIPYEWFLVEDDPQPPRTNGPTTDYGYGDSPVIDITSRIRAHQPDEHRDLASVTSIGA